MSERGVVSVVLPCFNVERFAPAALDSLLAQTYRQIEIVALDDGSTDATHRILDEYAARDPRVRVLRNETNEGLIFTLNRGIAEAKGEFVARMDADSVAAPDRIKLQLDALARRPEIGVVGTGVTLVDENGHRAVKPRPVRCLEPRDTRFMALFGTPIAHVTVLARAPLMKTHRYGASPHSLHTEDYELFTRMLAAGVGFANIPQPLVTVRDRPDGVSWRHEQVQIANFVKCSQDHLERTLRLRPDPGAHKVLVNRIDATMQARDLEQGLMWLDRVERAFIEQEPGPVEEIRGVADLQLVDILLQAALKGSPGARMAAGRLAIRYKRRLLSPHVRRYVAGKLGANWGSRGALAVSRDASRAPL